jgi:hypothetical protein
MGDQLATTSARAAQIPKKLHVAGYSAFVNAKLAGDARVNAMGDHAVSGKQLDHLLPPVRSPKAANAVVMTTSGVPPANFFPAGGTAPIVAHFCWPVGCMLLLRLRPLVALFAFCRVGRCARLAGRLTRQERDNGARWLRHRSFPSPCSVGEPCRSNAASRALSSSGKRSSMAARASTVPAFVISASVVQAVVQADGRPVISA